MANYESHCRTNYFHVTDESAYQQLFQSLIGEGEVYDFSEGPEPDGRIQHGFGCYGIIEFAYMVSEYPAVKSAMDDGMTIYDEDNNEVSYDVLKQADAYKHFKNLYTQAFCHPLNHPAVKKAIAEGKTLYKKVYGTVFDDDMQNYEVTVEELQETNSSERSDYTALYDDPQTEHRIYNPEEGCIYTEDDRYEDYKDFEEFLKEMQKILPDNEAFILESIGAEKLRYLNASCIIVTKKTIEYFSMQDYIQQKTKKLLGPEYDVNIIE